MRFRCTDFRTAVVLAKELLFFCPRRTACLSPISPLISPPPSSLTTTRNTYTMVLAFQDPRDEVGFHTALNKLHYRNSFKKILFLCFNFRLEMVPVPSTLLLRTLTICAPWISTPRLLVSAFLASFAPLVIYNIKFIFTNCFNLLFIQAQLRPR